MEQVSITAAIPFVLLAPATAWSECSWDHQDSWLRVQNASAPPEEYKREWHSSRTRAGNHRLLQDKPVSGLPCVSLQRAPGFWECTGEEQHKLLFPFTWIPSTFFWWDHTQKWEVTEEISVRRYRHLTKHLRLLQARDHSFYLLLSASSLQTQKV